MSGVKYPTYIAAVSDSEKLIQFASDMVHVYYLHFEMQFKDLYTLYDFTMHPAVINNFKDALMHFRKLNNCCEKLKNPNTLTADKEKCAIDAVIQFDLFSEHVNRGIIDAYVGLMQNIAVSLDALVNVLPDIANKHAYNPALHAFYQNACKQARIYMHKIKRHLYKMRKDKLEIIHITLRNAEHVQINVNYVVEFKTTCQLFYDINAFKMDNCYINSDFEKTWNQCFGFSSKPDSLSDIV